jgi:hypothetical protein
VIENPRIRYNIYMCVCVCVCACVRACVCVCHSFVNRNDNVRFQVLTAASMMFRVVFWDVLPCRMIVDNHFTRQYIPEDNSEQEMRIFRHLFNCKAVNITTTINFKVNYSVIVLPMQ